MDLSLFRTMSLIFILCAGMKTFSADNEQKVNPSFHPFKSAKAKEQYLAFNDLLSKKWPVAGENKMVETSFGQTFIRISGPSGAAPLVLLPGGGANSLMWRSNVALLSEHFRVYALDNIYDYGLSIYKKQVKSSDDFSDWLNELFTTLHLGDSVNVMGMSYGGWITSQFAIRYPNRINKIVLIAPAATVLPIKVTFITHALLTSVHPHFNKTFFNMIFNDLVNKDESGKKRVEEILVEDNLCRKSFVPTKFVLPTVITDEQLKNFKLPTMFLVGENEKLYSAKKAIKRMEKFVPHIKTVLIAGTGHDIAVTKANIVDSLVIDFLK